MNFIEGAALVRIQNIIAGLAVCGVVGATSSAIGSPLDPFAFGGGISVLIDDGTGSGVLTGVSKSSFDGNASGVVPGSGGQAEAQIQGSTSPVPTISGSVSNSVAGRLSFVSAVNNLDYYIRVNGPSGPIPLVVTGNGSLFSTIGAYSTDLLQVNGVVIAYVGYDTSANASVFGGSGVSAGFNPAAFAIGQTITVDANTAIFVHMYINAVVQGTTVQSASAFLDPIFFVDPTFVGAGEYSIETSFGITNGPAVGSTPIPAALPLFATGLGGLGLLGWRRRRKTFAVAA